MMRGKPTASDLHGAVAGLVPLPPARGFVGRWARCHRHRRGMLDMGMHGLKNSGLR